ncbi:MAG: LPXTG cell wall anchor domain-containing protein [Clostridia bacterium]|nr:LPXTG cell wall anchor domain-containing protein [Clostridia bacterium]
MPEEDVPLTDTPNTGDIGGLWGIVSALSASLFGGLALRRKKDEDK